MGAADHFRGLLWRSAAFISLGSLHLSPEDKSDICQYQKNEKFDQTHDRCDSLRSWSQCIAHGRVPNKSFEVAGGCGVSRWLSSGPRNLRWLPRSAWEPAQWTLCVRTG